MSIRLPRLLDDSLLESARLTTLRVSMTQRLFGLSTAEILLPHNAPTPEVRDLVELYDEHGSAGIFRVTEVQDNIGHTRLCKAEHSLCTLRDSMLSAFAHTGTVRETLTLLLSHQERTLWAAGVVDVPEDMTVVYATEYTDLLSAVELLMALLPEGYALDFDQSALPWKVHIRALPQDDACEGRLSRNLKSVRYDMDGSRICTRVYPLGAEVERTRLSLVPMEGVDYLQSAAANTWGVISRSIRSDLIFDVPTLREVAQRYLERHMLPETTTTVEAADLCRITGEALDCFRLGTICRLAMPDAGLILHQRIVAIEKPDVYGSPGQMTLTLTNRSPVTGDKEEVEHLIRQVTAGKLLGGTVTRVEDDNRAYGSYPSPVVHYFDVKDWAGILDVRVTFDPDSGVSVSDLRVDGVHPPEEVWHSGSFSAMPYLKRDELGLIAQGEHYVAFHPTNGVYGESCGMSSTVTLTVIEKKTQA